MGGLSQFYREIRDGHLPSITELIRAELSALSTGTHCLGKSQALGSGGSWVSWELLAYLGITCLALLLPLSFLPIYRDSSNATSSRKPSLIPPPTYLESSDNPHFWLLAAETQVCEKFLSRNLVSSPIWSMPRVRFRGQKKTWPLPPGEVGSYSRILRKGGTGRCGSKKGGSSCWVEASWTREGLGGS